MPLWMRVLGALAGIVAIVVAALGVTFGALGFWRALDDAPARVRAILVIQEQLGFRLEDTAYRHEDRALFAKMPFVAEVTPGKPMAAAGLRAGDRIGYRYADCVYAELVRGLGHAIALPVQRDSERLTLTVQVPELRLSDDPAQIHWACPHPAGHGAEPAPRAPKWVDGR